MFHDIRTVACILFLLLSATGVGVLLHDRVGEHRRTSETVDHVRLVVSILVTFTALVLSLLLSEVKGSFDLFDSRLRAFAGDMDNLDIRLREYGDEAQPVRAQLREYVAAAIADSWPDEPPPSGDYQKYPPMVGIERHQLGAMLIAMDMAIHKLDPPDTFHQRLAQSLANQMNETLRSRRQLIESAHDTVSWPLLLAMCIWLAVVFGVFGLIAPRNMVVYLTIVICALCVASAIFFIIEFDSSLDGFLRVASAPMRAALANIDAP
jgi:hypothetical protein